MKNESSAGILRFHPTWKFPSALTVLLLSAALGQAQSASDREADTHNPNVNAEEKKTDEVVTLKRYVVNTSQDKGYLSKNVIAESRTVTTVMNVPQTVGIANRELIEDLGANAMMDVVPFVSAGTTLRSLNSRDDAYTWGFRGVGALHDGVPYFALGGVGTMYDVDRIEVFQGPAALQFGTASPIGGTVNYVTRQPTKQPHFSADFTFGNFNYRQAALHATGPLSERWLYRVDVGAADSDISDRKFGFYRDRVISLGITFNINDRNKVVFSGNLVDQKFMNPVTVLRLDGSLFKDRSFTISSPFDYNNEKHSFLNAVFTSDFTENFHGRTFLSYDNEENLLFNTYANNYLPDQETITRGAYIYPISNHLFSSEQDFSFTWDTGPISQQVNFGGAANFRTYGKNGQSDYITPGAGAFLITPININNPSAGYAMAAPVTANTDQFDHQTYRNVTAYVQDTISLTSHDWVQVTGGKRFSDFYFLRGRQTVQNAPMTVGFGSEPVTNYGVIFHPVKDLTLYANHSEMYTLNVSTDYLGNPQVPSFGINKEVGGKWMLFNGGLLLTAARFDIQYTNQYVLFTQGAGDPKPGQLGVRLGGAQTNKGYDLTATASHKLGQGEVNAIGTLYHGDVRDQYGMTPVGPTNDTWSLLGNYRFTEGPLAGFGFGLGARHQGVRNGLSFPASTGGNTAVKYPAYTITNLQAFYRWNRFTFQLNVNNLADKNEIIGFEGPLWIYTDPGRTIRFSAGYKF